MNIIRDKAAPAQPTTRYWVEERRIDTNGKTLHVEGSTSARDLDSGWNLLRSIRRVSPERYTPQGGYRLVLVEANGGDR